MIPTGDTVCVMKDGGVVVVVVVVVVTTAAGSTTQHHRISECRRTKKEDIGTLKKQKSVSMSYNFVVHSYSIEKPQQQLTTVHDSHICIQRTKNNICRSIGMI